MYFFYLGKVGDICVAPFEFDNQWYRACITGVNANGTLDLYYIDFGDSNQVNINDVKAIRYAVIAIREFENMQSLSKKIVNKHFASRCS